MATKRPAEGEATEGGPAKVTKTSKEGFIAVFQYVHSRHQQLGPIDCLATRSTLVGGHFRARSSPSPTESLDTCKRPPSARQSMMKSLLSSFARTAGSCGPSLWSVR
eukprot:scaffold1629_cov369-Prasinococcus_capsulatus_cf.AAC.17